MAELLPPPPRSPAPPAPPEALVRGTWVLEPPDRCERKGVMRPEAAALVDGLLARVARGRGAHDVAVGEVLAALAVGDRVLRLGYSSLGDYARERLGIGATTARNLATLARELRDRPLLREAVLGGEVSARKASAVLPVARGEGEASWVARARTETVRRLEAAVRAERTGGGPAGAGAASDEGAEPWERVRVGMTAEDREKLERAMALAGRVLGAGAPRWQRLEAICQEYLGGHPSEPTEDEVGHSAVVCGPVADWLESAKVALEREMNLWDFLEPVPPVAAPVGDDGAAEGHAAVAEHDVLRLDSRLRELAAMRERWDVLLGHLAMLMKNVGLWRDAGFATFGHYCAERLGLATRTVEQRAALARRCYWLPGLREALQAGRISYEKARLVARAVAEGPVEDWIRKAEARTCIDLRREIEAQEDAQMRARGELDLCVPRGVRILVDAVVRAAREGEKAWLTPGQCLGKAAEHFLETWEATVPPRRTRHQKVIDRDGGWCRMPGCSRPAVHAHHVVHRSAGGGDDDANLASLCAAHHLHGVHLGWIRVSGTAPDGLFWQMAAPPRGPTG